MIRLTLPLPPSPNAWPKHHMAEHRAKRKYQRETWIAAVQQAKPPKRPPIKVRCTVTLNVWNKRDPDNLHGSVKFLLDTLRQTQHGRLDWREGLADECGYFIDDNPAHLELLVEQHVDRKNQRAEVVVEAMEAESAA